MGAVPADALVFYGATGDLACKKIFPALHGMTLHGNLPRRVIAVAKSGWTRDQLRARAFESIERSGVLVREVFDKFAASLTYIDGDYGDAALLTDALRGAATRFARQDYVEESWRIVNPILDDAPPVYEYEPGSWGPVETSRIAPSGGWVDILGAEQVAAATT